MKAVVLTFDRLPAHLLGCYGNEWTETPGFDRLASLGSVFDQHFAEPWVQNPLTALGSSLAPRGRKVRPHQSFGSSSLFPPDAQICSFAKEVTELGMIPQETRSLVHSI